MMLKTVVEPILLGTKPDEDTRRASVPRDHHLLRLSSTAVAGVDEAA